MAHVPRGDELTLFHVDGAAGAARGDEEVGLAAEEGGDLEDVGAFRGDVAVGWLVDVGEDGEAGGLSEAAQDRGAFDEAGSAEAGDGGAVGLVVGGFEDERNAEVGSDALDGFGHGADVLLALDDAGAGDEEELSGTDADGADLEFGTHQTSV